MAKDRYYTPVQSFPGIIAMSIALTFMAAATLGPKAVLHEFEKSAETLWDAGVNAAQHAPELFNNIMRTIPR